MGMSTHVVGIVPADEEWNALVEVWNGLLKLGINIPPELQERLGIEDGGNPSPDGLVVSIYDDKELDAAVKEWSNDYEGGYTIDLEMVPDRYKFIRVTNSW